MSISSKNRDKTRFKRRITALISTSCVAFALILASTLAAQAVCYRHIYNKSSKTWKISRTIKGEVGIKVHVVPPGGNLKLGYTCIHSSQSIIFEEVGGTYNRSFNISMKWAANNFIKALTLEQVDTACGCPRLAHQGNTGRAVLNDPVNGDAILID